jgi:hypothetical protein
MASVTQHFQLVKAEQRLLRSLAVPAVSNALSPARKLQLRAPDDPTFQPSFFGEGLAEVRAGVCVFVRASSPRRGRTTARTLCSCTLLRRCRP